MSRQVSSAEDGLCSLLDRVGEQVKVAYTTKTGMMSGFSVGILTHDLQLQGELRNFVDDHMAPSLRAQLNEAIAFRVADDEGQTVGGFTLSFNLIERAIIKEDSVTFLMKEYDVSVFDRRL